MSVGRRSHLSDVELDWSRQLTMNYITQASLCLVIVFILYCNQGTLASPSQIASSDFLPNWMGFLNEVIGNSTILDISIPGTHDTLTYDLSTTVSDNANDLDPDVAYVLHYLSFLPVGTFIKAQAVCQTISITDQLNAGVRFLDFRIVYTAGPDSWPWTAHDWWSLHMVESNEKAMVYMQQIHDWLMQHPKEMLVIWLSRHGSECATVYPNTPVEAKHTFFQQVTSLFGELVATGPVNGTTINQYLSRNQRVILYVSDYVEFTGSSPLATDGCLIDNQLGTDVQDITKTVTDLRSYFQNMPTIISNNKNQNKFSLRSLASSPGTDVISEQAKLFFQPLFHDKITATCAKAMNIPGLTAWCPQGVLDVGRLLNYYTQSVFEEIVNNDSGDFPNAIYINAVGANGVIETSVTGDKGYAYSDTVIYGTVRRLCRGRANDGVCHDALTALTNRRSSYPMNKTATGDAAHGRLPTWP